MNNRPILNVNLDSKTFLDYYYLKEELVAFCKKNGIPSVGGKIEITERIAKFLDSGEIPYLKKTVKKNHKVIDITEETLIEPNFVCSEKHRKFYKEKIGDSFTFNVKFQKWLKNNQGKTYRNSIDAYYEICTSNKMTNTVIDKQFEYNTYIRDFFCDNKDKSLDDAIKCWKYKKSLRGHNKYEVEDLEILKK